MSLIYFNFVVVVVVLEADTLYLIVLHHRITIFAHYNIEKFNSLLGEEGLGGMFQKNYNSGAGYVLNGGKSKPFFKSVLDISIVYIKYGYNSNEHTHTP